MKTGSGFVKGKFYPEVEFVDSPEKAEHEIVYDKMEFSKEHNCWLYFYHGYLVATAPNQGKNDDTTDSKTNSGPA